MAIKLTLSNFQRLVKRLEVPADKIEATFSGEKFVFIFPHIPKHTEAVLKEIFGHVYGGEWEYEYHDSGFYAGSWIVREA